MATERRKKNKLDVENDPPIIISGGGGVNISKAAGKSGVTIVYKNKNNASKKDHAKNNDAADITGVRVTVTTTGINPPQIVDLDGVYTYTIHIIFKTDSLSEDVKPGASSAGKGKKAAAKRPAASKKSMRK
jgi:hypothetical protein